MLYLSKQIVTTMDYKKDSYEKSNTDNDILFSKTVKAGKRIYYLDVKRDRRGEYYISMTESKRLKEQGDAMHPVFEKHKIFLYREDVEKFCDAFLEAARFTHERGRVDHPNSDWQTLDNEQISLDEQSDDQNDDLHDFRLNVEF